MLLPKADLHVHAETDARLDRVLARREGRSPTIGRAGLLAFRPRRRPSGWVAPWATSLASCGSTTSPHCCLSRQAWCP